MSTSRVCTATRLQIYSIIITSLAPNMDTTMTTVSYLWISEPCPILLHSTAPLLLLTIRQCLLMIPPMMKLRLPSLQARKINPLLAAIHKARCQIIYDVHNVPTAVLSGARGTSSKRCRVVFEKLTNLRLQQTHQAASATFAMPSTHLQLQGCCAERPGSPSHGQA